MSELVLDSYVELLPGREDVYARAQQGSRGWVRKSKADDYGYQMVFVEWDQDHWKFNGESDGWTFASHFKVIRTPAEDFAEQIAKKISENKEEQAQPELDRLEVFLDTLAESVEEVLASDGYFIIAVREKTDPQHPGMKMFAPEIYSATLTDEAQKMLEAQIVHYAALAHQEMTVKLLNKLREDKKQ